MMRKRGDVYPSNKVNAVGSGQRRFGGSAGVQTEGGGPVFFFDQPTRQSQIKSNLFHFIMTCEGPQLQDTSLSQQEEEQKGESNNLNNPNPSGDEEQAPSSPSVSAAPKDPMDAYRQAAPHLLKELAHLLSQHKWSEEDCIPRGIVNILNYSWHELTAGAALRLGRPAVTPEKQGTSKLSLQTGKTPRQVPDGARKETREWGPDGERNAGSCRTHFEAKQSSNGAGRALCPGGITQPKQHPCDEPESVRVSQRVVERLRAAKDPDYPSGCLAVCQSHSGLPCGGFYTNVFSDGQHPVTMVTITAFGHGAVTDRFSSTITAVWDQKGGLMFDNHGNTTKEWSWNTYHTPRSNVFIQVSEEICVRLFSGMSGVLSFRCKGESLCLPLRFITEKSQLKEMTSLQTKNKFSSGPAHELHLPMKQRFPGGVPESRSRRKAPMVKDEQQVEPSALWRRRGKAMRELQRIQQTVLKTVEGWLDCYRIAIGIKCPDAERLQGAPLWTRPGRAVRSAALPSLNSPECTAVRRWRDERRESHRCHSASAEKPPDRLVQIQRTLKQSRKEPPVTQIGPLQIHGNTEPESVFLPHSPPTGSGPADMAPLAPCIPLTTCPALLRAVLRGEERRRRCCCSATLMPVVTDLEYDAFVMGQPLDSKQILVVRATPPQQDVNTHRARRWDGLEELYSRRNRQRTMPCTQCQMDSFRLVRYEVSAGTVGFEQENVLLQQRHNAAPGMFLMYLKGKLLFLGYLCKGDSCSVGDLQRQIYRSRRDHSLGLSLPADHKFSDAIKTPAAAEGLHQRQQDVTPS